MNTKEKLIQKITPVIEGMLLSDYAGKKSSNSELRSDCPACGGINDFSFNTQKLNYNCNKASCNLSGGSAETTPFNKLINALDAQFEIGEIYLEHFWKEKLNLLPKDKIEEHFEIGENNGFPFNVLHFGTPIDAREQYKIVRYIGYDKKKNKIKWLPLNEPNKAGKNPLPIIVYPPLLEDKKNDTAYFHESNEKAILGHYLFPNFHHFTHLGANQTKQLPLFFEKYPDLKNIIFLYDSKWTVDDKYTSIREKITDLFLKAGKNIKFVELPNIWDHEKEDFDLVDLFEDSPTGQINQTTLDSLIQAELKTAYIKAENYKEKEVYKNSEKKEANGGGLTATSFVKYNVPEAKTPEEYLIEELDDNYVYDDLENKFFSYAKSCHINKREFELALSMANKKLTKELNKGKSKDDLTIEIDKEEVELSIRRDRSCYGLFTSSLGLGKIKDENDKKVEIDGKLRILDKNKTPFFEFPQYSPSPEKEKSMETLIELFQDKDVARNAIQLWLHNMRSHYYGEEVKYPIFLIFSSQHEGWGKDKELYGKLTEHIPENYKNQRCQASNLTDDREVAKFRNLLVGLFPEMQHFDRADSNVIKSKTTAQTYEYRQMRENSFVEFPNRVSFIGSTNQTELSDVYKDSSGKKERRFVFIKVVECFDGVTPDNDWKYVRETLSKVNIRHIIECIDPAKPISEYTYALSEHQHAIKEKKLEEKFIEDWVDESIPKSFNLRPVTHSFNENDAYISFYEDKAYKAKDIRDIYLKWLNFQNLKKSKVETTAVFAKRLKPYLLKAGFEYNDKNSYYILHSDLVKDPKEIPSQTVSLSLQELNNRLSSQG